MAFAIKNHFDRGRYPILQLRLLNWVRDAHYGPKIVDAPPTPVIVELPPPTQGIHKTWTCDLLLGTDLHPTAALRHYMSVTIAPCIQFRPGRRFLWYTFLASGGFEYGHCALHCPLDRRAAPTSLGLVLRQHRLLVGPPHD